MQHGDFTRDAAVPGAPEPGVSFRRDDPSAHAARDPVPDDGVRGPGEHRLDGSGAPGYGEQHSDLLCA